MQMKKGCQKKVEWQHGWSVCTVAVRDRLMTADKRI